MSKIGAYSVIPSYIMYDREVKPHAKLLYGTITSLSNLKGYCFASNGYLADLYGVTIRSIQLYISELQNAGYIEVEIIRKDNQQVEERKIWITEIKRSVEGFQNANRKGIITGPDDEEQYVSWMK